VAFYGFPTEAPVIPTPSPYSGRPRGGGGGGGGGGDGGGDIGAYPTATDPNKVAFYGFGKSAKRRSRKKRISKKKLDQWAASLLIDRGQWKHTEAPTLTPTARPSAPPTEAPTNYPTGAPQLLAPVGGGKRTQICGATTAPMATFWKLHGSGGLYFDVSTAHCKFPEVPSYFFDIVGSAKQWQMAGTSSVARPNAQGFRIILLHPSIRGATLLASAKKLQWVVSWIGNIGTNCGETKPGATKWDMNSNGALFVDVDTSAAAFRETPRYFTAIHGREKHWRTEGAHIVYYPKSTKFRIYVVVDECAFGVCVNKGVTPDDANAYQWSISWMGTVSKSAASAKWYYVKNTNGQDATGNSNWNDWMKTANGDALSIAVNTTSNNFQDMPTYITSCVNNHIHWRVSGAASIYRPQGKGFVVYLNKAKHAKTARFYHWRVNYLGYDGPVDCVVSPHWSKWAPCSKTCNKGTQERKRQVLQRAGNGGAACPPVTHTQICNVKKCPAIDCQISTWGRWTPCSRSCGGGTQNRTRTVVTPPQSGEQYIRDGKVCPSLSSVRLCGDHKCPVDCQVSGWSGWSGCFSPPTVACGIGTMRRKKAVTRKPVHGGKPCPADLVMTKKCYHKGPCVGEGDSNMCGGISQKPNTNWHVTGEHTIATVVSTKSCAYKVTPGYTIQLTNVDNSAYFGFLGGGSSISTPTNESFKVTIFYPKVESHELLAAAKSQNWAISWLAESGANSGITVAGSTGWKVETSSSLSISATTTLFTDVDTTGSGFRSQPSYFSSLHGNKNHWKLQGGHNIYNPTTGNFRLYVQYNGVVTAKQAEHYNWTVSWIGVSKDIRNKPPHAWRFAMTNKNWKSQGTLVGNVLFMDVGLPKPATFVNQPSFVCSVTMAGSNGFQMIGSDSTDKLTKTGFRYYTGKVDLEIPLAVEQQWEVSYISFEVMDCKVSAWSQWSSCSKSCAGGVRTRKRNVLVPHGPGGRPCESWKMQDTKKCNFKQCYGEGNSALCGATTTTDAEWFLNMSAWKQFGNNGIYLTVDTSACAFKNTPYYAVEVVGERFHWQLLGANSVSHATKDSLRVTVLHPSLKGLKLLKSAKKYKWGVSWVGEPGKNAGQTIPGASGWRQDTSGTSEIAAWTIYLQVSTQPSGFTDTQQYHLAPRYFTSIHGVKGAWRLRGAHILYEPTRLGFKVYVVCDKAITTAEAEKNQWSIAYIGTSGDNSGTSPAKWKVVDDASGSVWVSRFDPPGMYMDIDTSMSSFQSTPT
jgi:hypothetical protein